MKPFLKWAGNKFPLVDRIKEVLPEGTRLIEPFAGAAALFLNTDYSKYLVADTNADLINLYKSLKTEKTALIEYAKTFFIAENNTKERYYELRAQFNETTDIRLRAALFLYFNKHGYNGLCRYNSTGGYNVPFGSYKRPYFPEEELHSFVKKSRRAQFRIWDFIKTMDSAQAGDVVYCDPPYVPLSKTSYFSHYYKNGFDDTQQIHLAEKAAELSARGITVVISNHDTPFTREIYQGSSLNYFDVQRNISCDGSRRNAVPELLAVFS